MIQSYLSQLSHQFQGWSWNRLAAFSLLVVGAAALVPWAALSQETTAIILLGSFLVGMLVWQARQIRYLQRQIWSLDRQVRRLTQPTTASSDPELYFDPDQLFHKSQTRH